MRARYDDGGPRVEDPETITVLHSGPVKTVRKEGVRCDYCSRLLTGQAAFVTVAVNDETHAFYRMYNCPKGECLQEELAAPKNWYTDPNFDHVAYFHCEPSEKVND